MRHSRRDRQDFVLVTGPPKISGVRRRRRRQTHRTDRRHYRNQEGASDEDVSKGNRKGKKAESFKEAVLPRQVLVTA